MGGALCPCLYGSGSDHDPAEKEALTSQGALALKKMKPEKLVKAMETIQTQIAEQDKVLQEKYEKYKEAERRLLEMISEAKADPTRHTPGNLQVQKMLVDMARNSYELCQAEKEALVANRGDIEYVLMAHQDIQRREYTKIVTNKMLDEIAEYRAMVQEVDEERKSIITTPAVSTIISTGNPATDIAEVIDMMTRSDPRLGELVNQHLSTHLVQSLPSVPLRGSSSSQEDSGSGSGGAVTLDFTALLDPEGLLPTTKGPGAVRSSHKDPKERQAYLAMVADSV